MMGRRKREADDRGVRCVRECAPQQIMQETINIQAPGDEQG